MSVAGITVREPATTVKTPGVWGKAYTVAGAVLVTQFLAQFFLAGLGIFTIVNGVDGGVAPAKAIDHSGIYWELHATNGLVMLAVMLILIGMSFAARKPWRTTGLGAALMPLLVMQAFIAHTPIPQLSAVHVLNALLILALRVYLLRCNWAFGR